MPDDRPNVPLQPSGDLAVFVRAHAGDAKTLHLIENLSGSEDYDLFVCANETLGPIEALAPYRKISTTILDFEALGFPCKNNYTMLYLSDVLFSILRQRLPGYKYYALVEYDVHFEGSAQAFFSELKTRLRAQAGNPIDLVATNVTEQGAQWHWHRSASIRYGEIVSAFFPFVVLSDRAITQLTQARQDERLSRLRCNRLTEPSAVGDKGDWIFCEAFIASELKRAGFHVADLNWLVERAYNGSSFNVGPARFFEPGEIYDQTARIVHPVCPMQDTLAKRLYLASTNGTVPEFITLLDSRSWPLPEEVVDAFRKRAHSYLQRT